MLLWLLLYYVVKVTAEVTDKTKLFHLLGSVGYVAMVIYTCMPCYVHPSPGNADRNVLIETHVLDDPDGPANLYILVSDKNN